MFEMVITGYRWIFLQMASVLGPGWSIVVLSFVCSALMVPLMKAVGGIVKRETEYQSVINPQLDAIKANYATDRDRHLHIQRLYSRYNYSPLSAVKKVMPLFVQIPFLLLTYYMLKGTAELNGVSFLFLKDLGQADALIPVLHANLLPLVMTGVNILTVFATPSFTRKDWNQAIGIALLFLVLLYTAPAALLLYWTLNNAITFMRALFGEKSAGLRLLGARLVLVRLLPALLLRTFVRRPELFALAALLATAYFGLVLYALQDKPACFSYRVSYWGGIVTGLVLCATLASMLLLRMFTLRSTRGQWRNRLCALPGEFILLLLPMALAIHYSFSSEQITLTFSSVCYLVLYMIGPILVLWIVVSCIFVKRILPSLVFRICIFFSMGIYILPMVSTETGILGYEENIFIRVLIIASAVTIGLLVKKRSVLQIFSLVLVSTVLVSAMWQRTKQKNITSSNIQSRIKAAFGDAACVKTNNIYLLIHDSFAHQTEMEALGITDGVEVYTMLEQEGFSIYDSYSINWGTLGSMDSAFTIGGVYSDSARATICGDNVFCDWLRANGYKTSYLLSTYLMPQKGERKPGRYYFPRPEMEKKWEDTIYQSILRGLMIQDPLEFNLYSHADWLKEYDGVMEAKASSKEFIYAHFALPGHAPWEPQYRKSDTEGLGNYRIRVADAKKEIVDNLKRLKNDRNAIVIIASDHGPHLITPKGKCEPRHLLDRHGTMLAVRWPRDYRPCMKLNNLHNLFLEIVIYLSGDKSLACLYRKSVTSPMPPPISSQPGLVNDGIVQAGQYKGRDLFEAAAIDFGLGGSKHETGASMKESMIDLDKCRLSGAVIHRTADESVVYCTGALNRSWSEGGLSAFIADRQYIGLRSAVPPTSFPSRVRFLGRKAHGNGQPTLVMRAPDDEAVILFSKTYQELNDEWIPYTVCLPALPKGAELIFNGGYTDRSGSPESCYEFKDIRFVFPATQK